MSGTLYLIPTPIGNLEDITFRAIRILKEVQLIAAEDTRRTAKLLRHYGITTRTTSLHEHNEQRKSLSLVHRLLKGDSVALLSDAGTPVISDPGLPLVRRSLDSEIAVVSLPGPSAVTTALISTGAPTNTFTFVGFPPRRLNARKKWFETLAEQSGTLIFFESPHRLITTLKLLAVYWGDRQVALCREMTKIHECLVVGPIYSLLEAVGSPRGEYTCVVWPTSRYETPTLQLPGATKLLKEMDILVRTSSSRRAAIRELGREYGLTARQMYSQIETAKLIGQKT